MGMRSKRGKDGKSTGWIRDTVIRLYTADQVAEDWMAMAPAERLKLVGSWVPKETKIDMSSTFQLIINGLQNKAIESKVIEHAALDEHEEDD